MIRSSLRRFADDPNLFRDIIGILLALVIGMGGLMFVFSIPDPFATLASQVPMLSPADWPGSHASTGFGISTGWQWREKRQFLLPLELNTGTYYAAIEQKAVWYADPTEAAADWNQLDTKSYNEQPIMTSFSEDDKPASMLFCGKKDLPEAESQDWHECWYLAYWDHWYIEVSYRSPLEKDFPSLELQQITARVDQLLMSAPAEPCYGVLCTGTRNDIKP